MSRISLKQVEKIAGLAKLTIDENEKETLRADMEEVLAFADELVAINVGDTQPTTHAVLIQNVFREDICMPSYARDEILANAPEQDGACFIVPKVVE